MPTATSIREKGEKQQNFLAPPPLFMVSYLEFEVAL